MGRGGWFPETPTAGAQAKSSATGLAKLIAGGAFNYGLGQTLPLVLGFLLVPVYTAVLTPKDYGIVEMMSVIGGVLAVVARLGVPGAVTRYYYEYAEGPELKDYVTSVAWFLRVSAAIVGGLALILGYFFIGKLAPGLTFFPYLPLAVIAMMLATSSELQRRLIQVRRQSTYSARLSIANSLLAIALTILFVVGFRLGATGMLLAQVLTAAVFLANATMYLWPDLKGHIRPEAIRESVRYGRAIFGSHLLAAGAPLVSRSLLAGSASLDSVGLYSLAGRVTSPLTILSRAFATAYTPEYFAARKDGSTAAHDALAKVEAGIWTLAVVGTMAAALLGPSVILLLTPSRFHGAAALVPILALGFLGQVLYALASPEMFYVKRRWMPPVVTASSIVTTIGLTVLLVRPYGAHGVAWASVAGSAVSGVLCGLLAARLAPVPHNWPSLGRAPLLGAASMALVFAVGPRAPGEALLMGFAVLAINVAVLFATGDPAMRRIGAEVRARFVRARAAR